MNLHFDPEWLKRKIEEDGDEGEIGAGLLALEMDREWQKALDQSEERYLDYLFERDMADDRVFHTILPGESVTVRWLEMFGTLPVWLTANFFEEQPDKTWKCQVKQGLLYATIGGFATQQELVDFVDQWLIEIVPDE